MAANYAGLSAIQAIKLIPIGFDFINAFFVYRIAQLRYPAGSIAPYAFLVALFVPTVVLNGSFWGRTDMLYTSCLVACLCFLLTKKNARGLMAFGLAFSFKLQAMFLAPFLLILALKRTVSGKHFVLVPAVYAATLIPAWFVGRPLLELLQIYLAQPEKYRALSMNAPNLYQWLPNELYDILVPAGTIWCTVMVFFFVTIAYKSRAQLTDERMVEWATLTVLVVPYFMPKMHDRFFFPADILSVLLAFYCPSLFVVPIAICAVSFFSYFPFFFGYELIPLRYLALVLPVLMGLLTRRLLQRAPD